MQPEGGGVSGDRGGGVGGAGVTRLDRKAGLYQDGPADSSRLPEQGVL